MILVVDDDPDIRLLLSRLLSGAGYNVVTAENGEDALKMLDGGAKPDAILTDFRMPKLGGSEFIALLTDRTDAPVLIFSGFIDDIKRGEKLKVAAILGKPTPAKELIEVVRQYATPDREKQSPPLSPSPSSKE